MNKNILFLCGSLRAASLNALTMRAAESLLPEGYTATYFDLTEIPLYNQDLDLEDGLPAVMGLREAIRSADGVLWFTPEYNYGVPGVVKNAIDWASRPLFPQHCVVGTPMNGVVATMSATNGIRSLTDLRRYWSNIGGLSVPGPDCVIVNSYLHVSEVDGVPTLDEETQAQVRLALRVLANVIESGASEAIVANWHATVAARG